MYPQIFGPCSFCWEGGDIFGHVTVYDDTEYSFILSSMLPYNPGTNPCLQDYILGLAYPVTRV